MLWTPHAIQARAACVANILNQTFPRPSIPLTHSSHFQLLVAVMLSAQCTDKRVNAVTPALFKLAPDAKRMSALTQAEIYRRVKTCGMGPTKSKHLLAMSRILVERYHGKVPGTRDQLESLPGVGRKTASVVLIHAFGVPAMPVDTHILRSAQRWGLTRGTTVLAVEKALCELYPDSLWEKLHLQIIHYGRTFCTARGCDGPAGKHPCVLCAALSQMK